MRKIVRIVDAGANVGYASLYFLNCFPNAQITAIEPDKSNFSQLEINLSGKKVQCLNAALWKNDNVDLFVHNDFRDRSTSSFYVSESTDKSPLNKCTGKSLRSIFLINKWDYCDILKIDIEGGERQLFFDEDFISTLTKVQLLILEVHEEYISEITAIQILSEIGFRIFKDSENLIAENLHFQCVSN